MKVRYLPSQTLLHFLNFYWRVLFSIEAFPKWLQPLCQVLPLTHLNDAMRNVAFEGAHLADCGKQIGVLLLWELLHIQSP